VLWAYFEGEDPLPYLEPEPYNVSGAAEYILGADSVPEARRRTRRFPGWKDSPDKSFFSENVSKRTSIKQGCASRVIGIAGGGIFLQFYILASSKEFYRVYFQGGGLPS